MKVDEILQTFSLMFSKLRWSKFIPFSNIPKQEIELQTLIKTPVQIICFTYVHHRNLTKITKIYVDSIPRSEYYCEEIISWARTVLIFPQYFSLITFLNLSYQLSDNIFHMLTTPRNAIHICHSESEQCPLSNKSYSFL